MYVMDLEGTKV